MAVNKSKLVTTTLAAGVPGTTNTVLAADDVGYLVKMFTPTGPITLAAISTMEIGIVGTKTHKGAVSAAMPSQPYPVGHGGDDDGLFIPPGTALTARCLSSLVGLNLDVIYKEVIEVE